MKQYEIYLIASLIICELSVLVCAILVYRCNKKAIEIERQDRKRFKKKHKNYKKQTIYLGKENKYETNNI